MFSELWEAQFPSQWQVPRGEYRVDFERRTNYCVAIPVINEGDRILGQLRQMKDAGLDRLADIVICDGGSTDGSLDARVLREAGVRALLIKQDAGRLSAQLRMGYAFALQQGYQGVITIDGNGKDSVSSIPRFIEALDRGLDYAQGSRFVPGGRAVNTPLSRYLAIRLLHAPAISLSARHWLTDTTNGFRAYSRRYLLDPRVQPFRATFCTYELLAYLSVRASQLGLRVEEVPVARVYPTSGKIPTKISPVRGNLAVLAILFKLFRGDFDPKDDASGTAK